MQSLSFSSALQLPLTFQHPPTSQSPFYLQLYLLFHHLQPYCERSAKQISFCQPACLHPAAFLPSSACCCLELSLSKSLTVVFRVIYLVTCFLFPIRLKCDCADSLFIHLTNCAVSSCPAVTSLSKQFSFMVGSWQTIFKSTCKPLSQGVEMAAGFEINVTFCNPRPISLKFCEGVHSYQEAPVVKHY